jgi:hydroxypyruvate isomerase
MTRLAANLSMLFTELPFLDRFAAAAAAGFRGVEYMFPYEHDPQVLVERLRAAGLEQVLHNLPAGDWARGDRGIACDPGRVGEFQDSVGRALTYARALRCSRLNCLAGKVPDGVPVDRAQATLVDNLRFAARAVAESGIALLLEAVNTKDVPGFLVSTTRQALAILDAVGAHNLRYQYDIYHMQRMEGELAETLRAHLARIGHVQVADNPGRHEPGTGEINYEFLLPLLDRLGYDGWVGCEYKPLTTTAAGLGWTSRYTDRA